VNAHEVVDLEAENATDAVNQVISPGIAKMHLLRAVQAADTVAVVDKSVTSAERLDTLLVTAPAVMVDSAAVTTADKVVTEVAVVLAVDVKVKLATLVVAMDTLPAIALKVKNATTVAKLVTCLVIAVRQPRTSESATNASSQVMFKLHARIKSLQSVSRHAAYEIH